jgi:hypothetical protein
MKKMIYLILFLTFSYTTVSQLPAKDQVLMLNAKPNPDGSITLSWPKIDYTGTYQIYRRNNFSIEKWSANPVATLKGTENTWTDANVKVGEAYEYFAVKVNASNQAESIGYIFAGNQKPEITAMGNLILLIDSTYILALAQEIEILINDLTADGWFVQVAYAGRNETVTDVKDRIYNITDKLKGDVRTLFILGHVPVPYSGYFSATGTAYPPDGHTEGQGNHTGAWPADVFYGDFLGFWTDMTVNCTTGGDPRNHNIAGDGKYDQSKLPYPVQMEIGRVDLFNMPSFKKSDTLLIKEYLNRNHAFRTGKWTAVERALISNNFGGLNLASTGYHNFSTFFPMDSIFDNRDYISTQKKESYLWSYGCGPGSWAYCGGIGSTTDFVTDSFQNVFTILAGSFFGDWDEADNILRAPLASKSLCNFWGGIPKWYVHHMAMGMNIGYGTKLSQNNTTFYFNGQFNMSENSVHIALMGDPSLKMKYPTPPSNLEISTTMDHVFLKWNHSPGKVDGYCVFLVDTVKHKYTRVNKDIITDSLYTDLSFKPSGTYKYAVRAIRLESNVSGTYYNLSGGIFGKVDYVTDVPDNLPAEERIKIYPTLTQSKVRIESDITGTIRLIDLTGRILNESELILNADLDLSHFSSGFYIIQIIGRDGKIYNNKIMKY